MTESAFHERGVVEPAPRRLHFVPALDGLRGVAVLAVVTFHLWARFPHSLPDWWPRGGFLGVDAFFVLSGFLITALLLREQATSGRFRFRAFYKRRALRLLPALVALIAVQWVYATLINVPTGVERSNVIAGLFYYMNWKAAYAAPVVEGLAHLWSLAIEEQFYLVWPLIIMVLSIRRKATTVVSVLVALIVAEVIHRAVLFDHGVSWGVLYFRTDTHSDGLLIGALLAHLWVRRRVPTRGLQSAAWIALAFLIVCYARVRDASSHFLNRGGYALVALAVAVILLAVLDSRWSGTRFLQLAPLRAVGRVSYGLYLWHPLVFFAVLHYGKHWTGAAQITVALGATAIATITSRLLVERPFLALKDRSGHPRTRRSEDLISDEKVD